VVKAVRRGKWQRQLQDPGSAAGRVDQDRSSSSQAGVSSTDAVSMHGSDGEDQGVNSASGDDGRRLQNRSQAAAAFEESSLGTEQAVDALAASASASS
jgi:hypothetical protein